MDANLLLWIGQIVLALTFAVFGYGHAVGFERLATQPRTRWVTDVGQRNMAVIGVLDILGAIGVVIGVVAALVAYGRFVVAPR